MAMLVRFFLTVMYVLLTSSEAKDTPECGLGKQCSSLEFCDTYESRCKSCESVCRDNFSECQESCGAYLQTVIFAESLAKHDIYNLTVLVAITAAMTSVALVCLLVLLGLKLGKRKRLKKSVLPTSVFSVSKEKCDLQLKETDAGGNGNNPPSDMSNFRSRDMPNFRSRGSQMVPGVTSMLTVSTQLSDYRRDELNPSPAGTSSTQKHKKRLPSEDTVPEGRCNLGMDSSSCGTSHPPHLPHSETV